MKKFYFLAAMLLVGASATVLTNSCSSDDVELQEAMKPQTKAELLLAKSKEFAKKYNIEMYLDEYNLDKVAENLTVEELEQYYKEWAVVKNEKQVFMDNGAGVKTVNKLRMVRSVTNYEPADAAGNFTCRTGVDKGYKVSVTYSYSNMNTLDMNVTVTSFGMARNSRGEQRVSNIVGHVKDGTLSFSTRVSVKMTNEFGATFTLSFDIDYNGVCGYVYMS